MIVWSLLLWIWLGSALAMTGVWAYARKANNIGYVAEIDGDRETAQFFYDKAQALAGANSPVGLATRSSAEGQSLSHVASENDNKVEAKVAEDRAVRREQREPVLLMRRDNTVVQEPATPPPSNQPPQ